MFNNITYSHEHIVLDLSREKNDGDCYLNLIDDAVEELKDLRKKGVTRIVDCSNRGMGVNWEINKKVSEVTGIEIINSTGYYKEPFLPKEVSKKTVEELAMIMIDDLHNGAKLIGEIGTSLNRMTVNEEKVFTAACIAQKKMNCVIITHTTLGTMAKEQILLFKKFNVNLKKIIISHVALSKDLDAIKYLVFEGANVAFDTIGKENYCSDETQADFIVQLIKLGYQNQILLSMDCTRKSHLKKYGGHGYSYLLDEFIPLLINKGVKEETIEEICCNNFTRILEV